MRKPDSRTLFLGVVVVDRRGAPACSGEPRDRFPRSAKIASVWQLDVVVVGRGAFMCGHGHSTRLNRVRARRERERAASAARQNAPFDNKRAASATRTIVERSHVDPCRRLSREQLHAAHRACCAVKCPACPVMHTIARDRLRGPRLVAARQHAALSTAALLRLPLPLLADQAVVFLRRPASMQQDARDVGRGGARRRGGRGA